VQAPSRGSTVVCIIIGLFSFRENIDFADENELKFLLPLDLYRSFSWLTLCCVVFSRGAATNSVENTDWP
jgi:hypothetical protein